MRLDVRLYPYKGGDNEEPSNIAEVLSAELEDDDYYTVGSDIVLGDRRYNVYGVEIHGMQAGNVSVLYPGSVALTLFGYVGAGSWYKYRAVCTPETLKRT